MPWPFARRRPVTLWYHEAYRLVVPALEAAVGMETRRADLVAWHLLDTRVVRAEWVRTPEKIAYEDLGRVHPFEWIASLDDPERLARAFQLEPGEAPVGDLLVSVRTACGGTLAAARETLRTGVPALNLLGGFHHAAPERAAGFCLFNDIAVALAALREEGFTGRAGVLDFDAHPPDGTAACLAHDPSSWIGSLSGSAWGPLPQVDETVLPERCGDGPYLEALAALLDRMPRVDLAFVVAGGDVLHNDRLGQLGLTLDGARRRDLAVAEALGRTPAVWLPAGGYNPDAWRVLAGTGVALVRRSKKPIARAADPMAGRYARLALRLPQPPPPDALDLSQDIDHALGLARPRRGRLLGYYTADGLEIVFEHYKLYPQIRRLGYSDLTLEIEPTESGDLLRVYGRAGREAHVVIEGSFARAEVAGRPVLFVNWLSLRHPLAQFTLNRPRLPGQDAPGLGLLTEMTHLMIRMAIRLGLEGIAFRPAYYHLAYLARGECRFVDPARQGRFEALMRDLGHLPLPELSQALADGKVLAGGVPYAWEASDMAAWVGGADAWDAGEGAVAGVRDATRFELVTPVPD